MARAASEPRRAPVRSALGLEGTPQAVARRPGHVRQCRWYSVTNRTISGSSHTCCRPGKGPRVRGVLQRGQAAGRQELITLHCWVGIRRRHVLDMAWLTPSFLPPGSSADACWAGASAVQGGLGLFARSPPLYGERRYQRSGATLVIVHDAWQQRCVMQPAGRRAVQP